MYGLEFVGLGFLGIESTCTSFFLVLLAVLLGEDVFGLGSYSLVIRYQKNQTSMAISWRFRVCPTTLKTLPLESTPKNPRIPKPHHP